MSTEVAQQAGQVLIGDRGQDRAERITVGRGRVFQESLAGRGAGCAHQVLVLLIGHVVDAPSQRLTTGRVEGGLQAATVLRLQHLPTDPAEQRLHLLDLDAGDHPIEALAVQVDDPQHVAEASAPNRLVADGFPHVALVELGVADQGDEAARWVALVGTEVGGGVAVRQSGEQRRRRAETHRARREVDRIGVLGPTGIRLQAAEVA